MNRKGNIMDGLVVVMILGVMAITSVVVFLAISLIQDSLNADPSVGQDAKDMITKGESSFPRIMDFWFALFLIGLPLGSAVLAYFDNIHPLFFWLSLGVIIVIVILGASVQTLWGELAEDAELNTSMQGMPITYFLMNNLGFYSFFCTLVIVFGTFVKLRSGGGF